MARASAGDMLLTMRSQLVPMAVAMALMCAWPAPAPAAKSRLVARLYAQTHHPKVDAPWRIKITARTQHGKPVSAEVRYQFLYNGVVVARRSHYRFRGTFRDTLTWPADSVGMRLTFRAVVTSRIGRRNLDYWVEVRR